MHAVVIASSPGRVYACVCTGQSAFRRARATMGLRPVEGEMIG